MDDLLAAARTAADAAYVPHSGYAVGAAIRAANGPVFTGANVENANGANTLHAEELAVGAAVTAGHRGFTALAVAAGARDGVTPCGHCRQTLAEFCDGSLPIYCDAGETTLEYTLEALLPARGPQVETG